MEGGWRHMATDLITQHNLNGRAVVGLMSNEVEEVPSHLVVEGPVVKASTVRAFLWEVRREAQRACIMWSVYDEEKNQSVIGLGVPRG